MRLCSAIGQTRVAAARVNLSYPHGGGVLMAFAMALNREGNCKEIYARIHLSLVSYRPLALDCVLLPAAILEAARCPIC